MTKPDTLAVMNDRCARAIEAGFRKVTLPEEYTDAQKSGELVFLYKEIAGGYIYYGPSDEQIFLNANYPISLERELLTLFSYNHQYLRAIERRDSKEASELREDIELCARYTDRELVRNLSLAILDQFTPNSTIGVGADA